MKYLIHCTLLIALLAAATTATADDMPSARCLPAETLAAVRLPDGKAFADLLRKQTRFGAVFFSDDRWDRIIDILEEETDGDLDDVEEAMGQYGLSLDDLKKSLNGETGLSLVAGPREGRRPLLIALAWLEPGEEEAKRLFNAVSQALDEAADEDEPFPAQRQDIELGDYQVIHVTSPEVDYGTPEFDFDEEWEQMEEGDEQPPDFEDDEAEAEAEEAPEPRVVDQTHLLLTRRESKLLIAIASPQSREQVIELLNDEKKIDWDDLTGVEQLKGVFARFLEAHDDEAQGLGPFTQRAMQVKGLHDAMPAGVVGLELMVDLRAGMEVLAQFDDDEEVAPALDTLGLHQLGFAAMRWSLDGNVMRTGMFLEAPAPRKGLVGALDQEPIDPVPPAWAPADVLNYNQISLDLGKFYTLLKQMVIEVGGQDAANMFQMAEAQAMAMLQADMATLLSSLGHKHVIMTHAPKENDADADAEEDPFSQVPTQRTAIVWQLQDEQVWQRMMQVVIGGMFAPMSQGALQPAEEQGFTGWRMNQPPVQGGLFMGKGFLVLGIGDGVVETALAALSNPPEGDAALRTSKTYRRAGELMKLRPGLNFQVADFNRVAATLRGSIKNSINMGLAQAAPADAQAINIMARLLDAFPDDEKMEGMFGVATGHTFVDGNGLTGESIIELPPPDEQ